MARAKNEAAPLRGMKNKKNKNSKAASAAFLPRTIFMLTVLALTLMGFVMIYSASSIEAISSDKNAATYLTDQLRFAGLGVIGAFIVWKIFPYRWWRGPLLWVFWGVCVGLLLLTAATGTSALGAQRWVNIGPISLQPSEFAKVAFILMAARLFADFQEGAMDLRAAIVSAVVLVIVPVGFLYLSQSDLGTTTIIAVGILAVLWFGGIPARYIILLFAGIIVFGFLAIFAVGYRSDRMLYLNPWNDGYGGQGTGFQLIHSFYAFAQGGLWGVGLGNSREKYLYLPESETDFIFAIVGEELGMVGALFVIGAFLLLLWAGLQIAKYSEDDFGRMVAGALTVMLVFQAFLNIGCVIGVFPTTGKPLPFLSSGGTSLIATFMMVGIVLSVADGQGKASRLEKLFEEERQSLRVVRGDANSSSRSKRRL